MQMRHAFTRVRSAVDHDSIAAGQLQLLRHVARNQKQFAKQRSVLIGRVRETRNGFFRHDQDMHWRLRIDVVKRNPSSSSQMILAGIWRAIIFSKIVMSP